jgi:hypothetical protein
MASQEKYRRWMKALNVADIPNPFPNPTTYSLKGRASRALQDGGTGNIAKVPYKVQYTV